MHILTSDDKHFVLSQQFINDCGTLKHIMGYESDGKPVPLNVSSDILKKILKFHADDDINVEKLSGNSIKDKLIIQLAIECVNAADYLEYDKLIEVLAKYFAECISIMSDPNMIRFCFDLDDDLNEEDKLF